jgi:hypothetical protein
VRLKPLGHLSTTIYLPDERGAMPATSVFFRKASSATSPKSSIRITSGQLNDLAPPFRKV